MVLFMRGVDEYEGLTGVTANKKTPAQGRRKVIEADFIQAEIYLAVPFHTTPSAGDQVKSLKLT
jgi:hypothetical protein